MTAIKINISTSPVAWHNNNLDLQGRDFPPVLTPEPAPPSGFQAAWAMGSNVLIDIGSA